MHRYGTIFLRLYTSWRDDQCCIIKALKNYVYHNIFYFLGSDPVRGLHMVLTCWNFSILVFFFLLFFCLSQNLTTHFEAFILFLRPSLPLLRHSLPHFDAFLHHLRSCHTFQSPHYPFIPLLIYSHSSEVSWFLLKHITTGVIILFQEGALGGEVKALKGRDHGDHSPRLCTPDLWLFLLPNDNIWARIIQITTHIHFFLFYKNQVFSTQAGCS